MCRKKCDTCRNYVHTRNMWRQFRLQGQACFCFNPKLRIIAASTNYVSGKARGAQTCAPAASSIYKSSASRCQASRG